MFRRGVCFLFLLPFLFAGCRSETPRISSSVRLVSMQQPSAKQAVVKGDAIPKTEFSFDSADKTFGGWEALEGISGLAVHEDLLTGRTTSGIPFLHLERKSGLQSDDVLHSIEVKIKVSAGANLRIAFGGSEKVELEKTKGTLQAFPALIDSTPVIAGDMMQTYTLRPRFAQLSSGIRHMYVVPTDQSGADFAMESIRLVFRKEYLAGVPSGVSRQGLKGIYHETIVSRSPESQNFDVTLPVRPWLDFSLGTIEDGPVTFHVAIKPESGKEETVLAQTITRPHIWQSVALDLPVAYSGKKVTLSLSLTGQNDGLIGFWGSPVIRSRKASATATGSNAKPAQGVIVIWLDTLRKDHLDVYGYKRPTAPNMSRLAKQGVLFNNCVSQATWTKVASPTLFTGMYPTTHGVLEFSDRLPSSADTLSELFLNAGYATVGYSSNLFTASFSNFHQGFEQMHEDSSLPNPDSSKTTREYMDRLLPWLDKHRDVPYFVFLHAYDAHDPFEPYAPYNALWADPSKKEEHERQTAEARKVIKSPLLKVFGMPNRAEMVEAKIDPEAYVSHIKDWYDGSIRAMDAEIGRLLEALQTRHLDKKTLVVIAGDHGEEFLEHERLFHGQTIYSELTGVPLILSYPGTLPQGLVIDDPVEIVDVMPTVLEVNGLRGPKIMQGQSLTSLFTANTSEKVAEATSVVDTRNIGAAFSIKARTKDLASPPPQETESFSVVLDEWKLIHNTHREGNIPEFELFYEKQDPLNLKNVAEQNPAVVKRLNSILEEWRHKSSLSKLKPDSEAAKGLSQEELERLRSLGYIQ